MNTSTPIRHAPGVGDLVLRIEKSIEIEAPIDIAWDALLAQFGPMSTSPDGEPMHLVLEPRPGGRWFRDLAHNTGHLWGHVQVIKPPNVLELCGPMFMSYPVAGHISVRLKMTDAGCIMRLVHTALGLITNEHRESLDTGWGHWCEGVRAIAQSS